MQSAPLRAHPARPSRKLAGLLLAGAVTLALAWAGCYHYHVHCQYRLGAVTPGSVYKAGVMPPEYLAKVATDLGLRTVIDLRTTLPGIDATNTSATEELQAETRALAAVGVRHIQLPTGQVPSETTVAAFLEVIRKPENRPTLIHCYHGIGRTELFVAVYRMELEGWSNARARGATRWFLPGSSFSGHAEKGRFLIDYRPQATRPTPIS